MLAKLIALFTITPLVELYILFQMAEVTSPSTTILLVLVTGIAGGYLAQSEGKMIISKIKMEFNSGRLPGNELING